MSIKRNVFLTALAVTAITSAVQIQAQQTQAHEKVIKPLSGWSNEEIYEKGGIRADSLMDAEVFGENEDAIGSIENVLITEDNKITAIIAQVGGLWDIGDTHVLVPWEEAEIHEDGVMVPVTEDNVDDYGLFASNEYITQQDLSQPQRVEEGIDAGIGVWKLTSLLDDYATVGEGIGYGYINNILFSSEGEIQAVIVETGAGFGSGTYAYPFYGDGYGWNPGDTAYTLQYDKEEVGDMESFDYNRYNGLLDE